MKNKTKETLLNIRSYILAFLCWAIISITLGSVCGVVGSGFSRAISFGIGLRQEHGWLLYFLPLAGILSVLTYKLLRVTDIGTNRIIESARDNSKVPLLLAPAIFTGTVISHTFGASAGKEGAALQLGGSISSLFCRIFRFGEKTKHILTMCGMAALFSSLFGAPLGASVFAIEVASVGYICSAAIFPCLVSGISAYLVSDALGTQTENFTLSLVPQLNMDTLWRVAVIGIAGALVSILFCKALHLTEGFAKKFLKNDFLRIVAGGGILVLLPFILRTTEYNGGGMDTIIHVFEQGEVKYEAFALKILFTAITVAAGFKGGEIVPTMFIGATLGGSLASLLGLDVAFGAAVGIAALFCGVTNCPLGTLVLCTELFGSSGMIFFALSLIISFLLSGKVSLYSKQHFVFSKLNDEKTDNESSNEPCA